MHICAIASIRTFNTRNGMYSGVEQPRLGF